MSKFAPFPSTKGEPRQLSPADPAAGANFSVLVPAGGPGVGPVEIWRPLMVRFNFVTAVAVANRYIRFYVGRNLFISSTACTASTNWRVGAQNQWNRALATGAVSGQNYVEFPLPEIYCAAGFGIYSDIIAIQAADQLSALQIDLLVYRDRGV